MFTLIVQSEQELGRAFCEKTSH